MAADVKHSMEKCRYDGRGSLISAFSSIKEVSLILQWIDDNVMERYRVC